MKGLVSPRMKLYYIDAFSFAFFIRIYMELQIRKTFSGIYNHKFVLKKTKNQCEIF